MQYTWLSKFLLYTGIIGGIGFITFVFNYWSGALQQQELSLATLGSAFGGFFSEGYDLFIIGGLKYVILILMEVIIFHFVRRTLEIKTGQKLDTSIKTFISAQIRMIRVVIYSYFMETVMTIIAGIILKMFGFGGLKPMLTLIIQAYFLGFAVVDNYNEIYHMTIKQSARYTLQYATVALITGVVVYVIMMVPVAGSVIGPMLGAVVATLTMHELYMKDRNMAWIFTEDQKK